MIKRWFESAKVRFQTGFQFRPHSATENMLGKNHVFNQKSQISEIFPKLVSDIKVSTFRLQLNEQVRKD